RFPVQPVFELRVPSERVAQDLDGDGPVEPRVARLVDFAHAPRAEPREDLVGAEACATGQGHESTPIVATMPVVAKANRSGCHPALLQRLPAEDLKHDIDSGELVPAAARGAVCTILAAMDIGRRVPGAGGRTCHLV